jgi:hypothetical protein
MSATPQSDIASTRSFSSLDDAEKGTYYEIEFTEVTLPPPFAYLGWEKSPNSSTSTKLLCPLSPIHQGTTPAASVPELSLPFPAGSRATDASALVAAVQKPAPAASPKISRWILFVLWFNVYRRFFTFITLLNLAGIIMAALGRFSYAENHLGALVLGNLLCAILMRNELWIRFLYMVAIYGLHVSTSVLTIITPLTILLLVGSTMRQTRRYISSTACWRHPFRMRTLWCCVSWFHHGGERG